MTRNFLLYIAGALLFPCIAWLQPHPKREVEAAMQKYNETLRSMNVDSIAAAFMPNGDLGPVAHGRDSIKHFLMRYKDFRVLSQTSTTTLIVITADSALQKGMYWQTTIVPSRDTVHVRGDFTVQWVWLYDGGWKIKRMDTMPVK